MHITLIQCNGLERNKKFFEKKLSEKTFLSKKFYEKNKFKQKKLFGNFLKFLSVDISEGHMKINVFHI